LDLAQRVLGIPFKRAPQRAIDYLEYEEIESILKAIDRTNLQGTRDYALLATMFNTGARVQEIADLRACDLQLTKPFQVKLFGKGTKERYCPLWPQTAAVLRAFATERNLDLRSEVCVFLNHHDQPLTRFGIRYILARCLARASRDVPNLRKKRLHPHSMRHSTAVALLKSGNDLSTIAHYLGHANPDHDESIRESGSGDETSRDRAGQTSSAPVAHTMEQRRHHPRLVGVPLSPKKCGAGNPENRDLWGFRVPTSHY